MRRLLVLAALLILSAESAFAQAVEPDAPGVEILDETAEFETLDPEIYVATIHALNGSDVDIIVDVSMISDEGSPVEFDSTTGTEIKAQSVSAIGVIVPAEHFTDVRSGRIIMNVADAQDTPATITFVVKTQPASQLWPRAIFGGLATALLVLFGRWISLKEPSEGADKRYRLSKQIDEQSQVSWSFSQSWASNIAAIGTLLGTLLGLTGLLERVAPGLDTTSFAAINVVLLFIALLAPIAYVALSEEMDGPEGDIQVGTYRGLLIGCLLTLWSVYGLLIGAHQVVVATNIHSNFKSVSLGSVIVVGLLMAMYAFSTIRHIMHNAPAPAPQTVRMAFAFPEGVSEEEMQALVQRTRIFESDLPVQSRHGVRAPIL